MWSSSGSWETSASESPRGHPSRDGWVSLFSDWVTFSKLFSLNIRHSPNTAERTENLKNASLSVSLGLFVSVSVFLLSVSVSLSSSNPHWSEFCWNHHSKAVVAPVCLGDGAAGWEGHQQCVCPPQPRRRPQTSLWMYFLWDTTSWLDFYFYHQCSLLQAYRGRHMPPLCYLG